MSGCSVCGGYGDKHDLGAHFDAGEEVRVTYAEGAEREEGIVGRVWCWAFDRAWVARLMHRLGRHDPWCRGAVGHAR